MACVPLVNRKTNRIVGFMCGFHPAYEFGGFLFEIHSYCGPTPLRRDNHDPRVNIPKGFWQAWEAFEKLSGPEREKWRVEQ